MTKKMTNSLFEIKRGQAPFYCNELSLAIVRINNKCERLFNDTCKILLHCIRSDNYL